MATNLKNVKASALTSVITSVSSPGVKITGLTYSNSTTAANPAGSETITVNGSGFNSGATVYIDTLSCSTTYISSTSLTFISPAKSIANYHLFVYNTDGSVGMLPGGMIYSSIPVWATASGALTNASQNSSYSQSVSATGDGTITYSLTSGSLPIGLSLNTSSGAITGTPTVIATSNFSITATDSQNQTSNRSFSIEVGMPATSTIDYVIVAGGGGGGSRHAGGGGAGGYLTAATVSVTSGTTYTITVGAGGDGGNGVGSYGTSNIGGTGGNSSISGSGFSTVTAIRGGGGGAGSGYATNGGSGGGDSGISYNGNPGKGVYSGSTYLSQARQGYDGGVGGSGFSGGGGGGAGGAGVSQSGNNGGNGGVGVANPFTGSTVGQNVGGTYYIGGGGGGGNYYQAPSPGVGGNGGGGTGSNETTNAAPGTANTGGGGGGSGGGASGQGNGGNGGSGVVIIRYPDTYPVATSTTGSPTVTNPTGYRVYTFTTSGSITF